jgi:hypothetical protein
MSTKRISTHVALAVLAFAIAPAAKAQTSGDPPPPSREELLAMIDQALPKYITEDNAALVRRLQSPTLGDPPSKTFDRTKAIRAIFGRLSPTLAPACKKLTTENGEPDPDECMASRGSPGGAGAFTQLEFSKHPGFGNFAFLKRGADAPTSPTSLVPVNRGDEDAMKLAMEFLSSTFGLSGLEMPHPPVGQLPVRTLFLGFNNPAGVGGPAPGVGIQKHVFLQRMAFVGADPALEFVSLPGRAVVQVDDMGVQGALVDGWGDLVPHPGADPSRAKGRRQLADEMADTTLQDLGSPVQKLSARIHLAGVPDGTRMMLLPAIELWVSPVPDQLGEGEQATRKTTAGVVHDFMLVPVSEGAHD